MVLNPPHHSILQFIVSWVSLISHQFPTQYSWTRLEQSHHPPQIQYHACSYLLTADCLSLLCSYSGIWHCSFYHSHHLHHCYYYYAATIITISIFHILPQ
jgi:hypothetical protein